MVQFSQVSLTVQGTDLLWSAAIVVGAFAVVSVLGIIMRQILRAIAGRSLVGKPSRWRPRAPRLFGETFEVSELRRQQRIDATATMVARVLAVVVWTVAGVLILRQFDTNGVHAISGAGFLGVGLAIGGQHSVADFLTGLHILLEDRFGEGDTIQLKVDDDVITGTVAAVGAFASRVETDEATVHVANRNFSTVVNRSQRGFSAQLKMLPPKFSDSTQLEDALRACYARTDGYDPSRDGLVVDSVERQGSGLSAIVRTARPLSESQLVSIKDLVSAI